MDKSSLASQAAGLKEQQAATAKAVEDLKAEFSSEALVDLGMEKAADAARSVVVGPSGMPRPWVCITVAGTVALAAITVAVRVWGRKK
ncbi:MAG: hypothetical protein LBJ02_06505 [Bifidobacteriaceae bacterium]|jgi:hypothetical protein|nr:hypothetical protein [Bifidobacteriaceae bacterium]